MIRNKKIEIVFVGKTPFPVSTASSNRILNLGKGLNNAGANVSVYCLGATKYSTNNMPIKRKGTINGIKWHYTSIRINASKIKLINGLYLLLGKFICYIVLFKNFKNKKPVFFTSQFGLGFIIPLWIMSKLINGKLIFFRSEYPKSILQKSKFRWYFENIVYPISIKKFDGMFFMTRRLKDYFNKWKRPNAFSDIAPLSIDISLFKVNSSQLVKGDYIAYSGNLSNKKDGVDILIKSFAKISSYYPDLKLIIIGEGSDLVELKNLADELFDDNKKVLFTGLVDYKVIPKYINNANILALARPNSVQAEGGFPSKLGEYLATGNPVVVTDTGEIGYYLKDKINARIAKPNSIDDFSDKLKWLIDNYQEAKKIGLNGQKVAENNFDANIIGSNIIKKLAEL